MIKKIYYISNLNKKIAISTFILCLYYFISPLFFFDELREISFYESLQVNDGLIALQSFSAIIIAITIYISTRKTKSLIEYYYSAVDLKIINRKISNWTVLIMCLSSIPLAFGLFGGLSDRTESYSYILDTRQNVFLSITFTLALISSMLLYIDDERRNILILGILVVLPELMFGTRISAFRMLFLFLIFTPWKIKYLLIGVIFLLLIGFSRAIFNDYSTGNLVDFIVLFAGDPLNIILGTSLLYTSGGVDCGIDGLHLFRIALPPIGVRPLFDEYIGDVTVCINAAGFGGMGVYGLGGSASNDLLVSPISVFISIGLVFIISRIKWFHEIHPILRVYIPILILSCAPYIMRNGLISTVNHMATVIFWVAIPLLLIIKKKRTRSQIFNNREALQ